jgi:hypothetical protein
LYRAFAADGEKREGRGEKRVREEIKRREESERKEKS